MLNPQSPRLLVLLGATGVGKTRIALELAQILGAEIISADSMQVYRYLDIGTAKPGIAERARICHHMIDVVNPDEEFNVALYVSQARCIIDAPENSSRVYIIVGGTGLYIRALLGGLIAGTGEDSQLRAYLRYQFNLFGKDYLYNFLKQLDPLAAEAINANDINRMIRAIEVRFQSGKSLVEMQQQHNFNDRPYRYLKMGLKMEREELYRQIERRTDEMIDSGFVAEVEWLAAQGYHGGLKSMQSIGYRHLMSYLQGECLLDQAVAAMKRDTRKYAKRQETWFKADAEIRWFERNDFASILRTALAFLHHQADEQVIF